VDNEKQALTKTRLWIIQFRLWLRL